MAVRIHLDEMTGIFADEFWKVTIIDDDAETTPKTVEPIQAGLRDLIIANENGYLKEGFWGVKERFIAAALLRGMRVEDIVDELKVEVEEIKVEESTAAGQFSYWNLNRTKDGEPPILSVTTEGTSLAWEFYVLKAREVLVAGTGIELAPELQDEVNIQSMEWLKNNIHSASAVRHRFVVLVPETPEDLEWINSHQANFPFRTFIGGSLCRNPIPGAPQFACLGEATLKSGRLGAGDLYEHWLRALDANLDGRYIVVKNSQGEWKLPWNSQHSHERLLLEADVRACLTDQACLGFVDRHWHFFRDRSPDSALHYEIDDGSNTLRPLLQNWPPPRCTTQTLFEAALVKVLIVDEREDAVSERR